jgi:hypothetical protein
VPRRASFSRVGSLTSTIARQSAAVATAGIHPCCPLAPNRSYPSAAGTTALGTEPAGNAGARCHFVALASKVMWRQRVSRNVMTARTRR